MDTVRQCRKLLGRIKCIALMRPIATGVAFSVVCLCLSIKYNEIYSEKPNYR